MPVKFRDYYEVLGVPRTASADDIRRAYRKLARTHHPDLKPQAERAKASEAFKEINEAYEVLSDSDKRKKYDALGADWKNGQEWTPPPGWGGAPGGGRPGGAGGGASWEEFGDFSDFFNSLFGGHGARAGRRGRGRAGGGGFRVSMPGMDVEAEMPIGLAELIQGGRKRITLGEGRQLEVEIPKGARDGTVLRLAGQGEPGGEGAPAGDLYLRLRFDSPDGVRVDGDDLEMDLPLWSWQAVLGAEVRFETPEGAVKLKVPAGSVAGGRLRLRERGLPRPGGGRGDLYAVITIAVPAKATDAEREAFEALKRASSAPPDRPAEG
jgi:curved DNA-binding protein